VAQGFDAAGNQHEKSVKSKIGTKFRIIYEDTWAAQAAAITADDPQSRTPSSSIFTISFGTTPSGPAQP
jgi:hypothetical protein